MHKVKDQPQRKSRPELLTYTYQLGKGPHQHSRTLLLSEKSHMSSDNDEANEDTNHIVNVREPYVRTGIQREGILCICTHSCLCDKHYTNTHIPSLPPFLSPRAVFLDQWIHQNDNKTTPIHTHFCIPRVENKICEGVL